MKPMVVWRFLSWVLFGAFLVAGLLNMTNTAAGFATNHLADLVGPAWLYIVFRGLAGPEKRNRLGRILGATPERAATILFVGSSGTEITQIYWPSGLFAGRFDPLDIAAFAAGIVPLYLVDRMLHTQSRDTDGDSGSRTGAGQPASEYRPVSRDAATGAQASQPSVGGAAS